MCISGADRTPACHCLQAAALLEEDPVPPAMAESSGGITTGGADVLQIEDSGDALDINLDDPFQAQMLDISQPIVADEHMLQCLKQQVHYLWFTDCGVSSSCSDCSHLPVCYGIAMNGGYSSRRCKQEGMQHQMPRFCLIRQ